MGDGNRIRQGAAWTSYGKIYVRQGAAWPEVNRAFIRESFDWKLVFTKDAPTQLTCIDQRVCQVGGNPGCGTLSGCTNNEEVHRVEWQYSGSSVGFHLSIHRSKNGGGYVEWADNVDLDQPNPDVLCCEIASGACDNYDGAHLMYEAVSSDMGACTSTYQYRGRAEIDGTDTLSGSAVTHSGTDTGCDEACLS